MNDEGRTQREIIEGGEAGRGKHGVREGGSVGGRDLRRREGGREIRAGQAGGEEGVKDGREGDTNDQCQAWSCTEACQWLLAFTLY